MRTTKTQLMSKYNLSLRLFEGGSAVKAVLGLKTMKQCGTALKPRNQLHEQLQKQVTTSQKQKNNHKNTTDVQI